MPLSRIPAMFDDIIDITMVINVMIARKTDISELNMDTPVSNKELIFKYIIEQLTRKNITLHKETFDSVSICIKMPVVV